MKSASNTNHATISTIAELVFVDTPVLNFARLVSELDAVLQRLHPQDRTIVWDCDDLAIFDVPGTRLALAYTEAPREGVAASLLIAVGPSPRPAKRRKGPSRAYAASRHDLLCSKLVDRVQARLVPQAIYWHESTSGVSGEVIEALSAVQPKAAQSVKPRRPQFVLTKTATKPVPPIRRDHDLLRLRAALYPEAQKTVPQLTSNQMRLAAHAMNATLIMASLPLGAALTTYAVLRGENMRMTTAALVFTGLAGLMTQGGIAQQILAFASI
jgi:hypothetical protein